MKNKSFARPFNSLQSNFSVLTVFMCIVLFALLISGCATQAPVEEEPEEKVDLVWPNPPQEAVIKYIDSVSIVRESEPKKKKKFADLLAGQEEDKQLVQTLLKPWGVSGDPQGRLFVVDTALAGLFVFDRETKKAQRWGETGMGKLSKPLDVTSDRTGRIYVTDSISQRVVVFDAAGRYVTAFGGKEIFDNPVGIQVNDKLGRIYVSDSRKHQICIFNLDGELLSTFGKRGSEPGEFNYPTAIALGKEGQLFVTDTLNFRVQVHDAEGNFLNTFGTLGDRAGNLSRPKGVAVDPDGHVYVVDNAFSNVQIFRTDGRLLLSFGESGDNPGQFQLPTGISIDSQGFIYVADQLNKRVQILKYLGEPSQDSEVPLTSPES